MKKFLFLLIMISFKSFSQITEFPDYYIQSGDTIGVIYSIKQAEKIYNQSVLLELYEGHKLGCDSLQKNYKIIINKYEQKQLVDADIIEKYKRNIKDKDDEILMFEKNKANYELDITKCNDASKLKDDKISNLNQINTQLKRQRNWLLGGVSGLLALVFIYSLK